MKIEMGESLIYSWLRHDKQCQLAQTNWKASPFWTIDSRDDLQMLADKLSRFYLDKHQFDLLKGCSLEQFIKQAEIDAIGIAFSQTAQSIYAVDVAYHEGGLNYGDKERTLTKIIQKCVRTALCLYGFFNIATGEIVFASPKINPAIEKELSPLFSELTELFSQLGLEFTATLFCNDTFLSGIMQPVLEKGTSIADTSELFLRSVQMYQMFAGKSLPAHPRTLHATIDTTGSSQRLSSNSSEGKAIDRIPKWALSPEQNNYRIIRAYYQLLNERGLVTRPELEARCKDENGHPDVYVRDFRGNFASMKTDKGKSHGKVFTDDGYNVRLWDTVLQVMEQNRSRFLV